MIFFAEHYGKTCVLYVMGKITGCFGVTDAVN